MPRINVDEGLFHDPRWFYLLQSERKPHEALGILVLFWFLGQRYWDGTQSVIPEGEIIPLFQDVIDAGFGEVVEGGVYVCGAKNRFSWLNSAREIGKIGGKVSAKRPRDKLGRLLPAESNNVQETSKRLEKHPSVQPSSSSSSSSSSSKKRKNIKKEKPNASRLGARENQKSFSKKPNYSQGFLKFWESYPRKTAKSAAYQAFKKYNFQNGDLEEVLRALEVQKASEQWQDERYIPHAATWLNQRRFEDEIPKEKNWWDGFLGGEHDKT